MNTSRLKSAIPPAEFFRVELPGMPPTKRANGWVDGGLCPFHDDHNAGNFRINLDNGAFKCFACGARGGDIIAFVMRRRRVSFPNAIAILRNQWGV
ncbi:MAG TPA: CHC2 zinc finger domain-containing protein [Candidatus Latescibacteria bacterium]|nr:CHC2 zinc finger domain-containing protein [Candidatus Latescibacterota bacterium]